MDKLARASHFHNKLASLLFEQLKSIFELLHDVVENQWCVRVHLNAVMQVFDLVASSLLMRVSSVIILDLATSSVLLDVYNFRSHLLDVL